MEAGRGGGGVKYFRPASRQRQRDHLSSDVSAFSLTELITVGGLLIGANRTRQSDQTHRHSCKRDLAALRQHKHRQPHTQKC